MKLLKRFLSILAALSVIASISVRVMADDDESGADVTASAGQNGENAGAKGSVPFFLFSDDVIEENRSIPIIALFSNIKITAGVDADIYAFFSHIEILDGAGYKKIHTLSSTIITGGLYNQPDVSPIFRVFASYDYRGGYAFYNDEISPYILALIFVLLQFVLVILFYLIKKGFIEQGTSVILKNPEKIVRNGIIGYLSALLIIVLFAISVAFLPVAALLLLFAGVTSLVGEASFALLLGVKLMPRGKGKRGVDPIVFVVFGELLITLVRVIPIIGWYINALAMPIVCVGIVVTNIINGYFKKVYYNILPDVAGTCTKIPVVSQERVRNAVKGVNEG